MKTKEEFIELASSLFLTMNKNNDGCFLLTCEECGEGTFILEGTYNRLYNKYKAGCPFCGKELTLKIGHSDL